jgi:hypothetical protein
VKLREHLRARLTPEVFRLNRFGIPESGRTTASNPGSTGARGDKSFGAGAGNLLKVALSVKTQSFGVALLARSPNCSQKSILVF